MMSESLLRLSHFNEAWGQEFQQEKSCVMHASEGWLEAVEHVGSTCLEDAISRPIIDLVASYRDPAGLSELTLLIEGINYCQHPTPRWVNETGVVLLHKPRHREPSHIVWLVPSGGTTWQRMVRMRNWYHENPSDRLRFVQFKFGQLQQHSGDVAKYESAKKSFFVALEDQIEAAGKST